MASSPSSMATRLPSSPSSIGIYGIEVTRKVTKMQPAVPLQHVAARDGDMETIKRLIAEAGEGILSVTDSNGWMPVHMAARTGQLDLLKFVSEVIGISSLTTQTRHSMTPAHLAARGGHLEVMKFLVDTLGSKILLARDEDGWTAAHSGARAGDLIMLKYILETVGLIALSGPGDGPTLIQVAKKAGHSDAVQYLKEMTDQINQKTAVDFTQVV